MRIAVTTTVLAALAVVGLAVLGANGPPLAAVAPGETTVVLTARHSRFSPQRLSVPVGTTVRFVVENLDPIDHELIVGDEATHRRHEAGREAHHHGEVAGEISVPAGTTASTTYTVTEAGPVRFACHLPGHLAYGMAGVIVAV